MGKEIVLKNNDYDALKICYKDMRDAETQSDVENFTKNLISVFDILDPYWGELDFTFGVTNVEPLYSLVKLTTQRFGNLPKQKDGATQEEHLKEIRNIIKQLLTNNGINLDKDSVVEEKFMSLFKIAEYIVKIAIAKQTEGSYNFEFKEAPVHLRDTIFEQRKEIAKLIQDQEGVYYAHAEDDHFWVDVGQDELD